MISAPPGTSTSMFRTSLLSTSKRCAAVVYPRPENVVSIYEADASNSEGLKRLCSRPATAVTCRRRLSAMSLSSAVSGLSAPADDLPGTTTMYHSSPATAATSVSQKSMRAIGNA